MLIWPPSTRSMRAVPDLTRTSPPLRRTVFTWPWTTSTLIGPVTLMDSPSMTPTESLSGSSGRAEAAAMSAAQRMARQAAGSVARRQREIELEMVAIAPVILQATDAESLAYTIRRVICSRIER